MNMLTKRETQTIQRGEPDGGSRIGDGYKRSKEGKIINPASPLRRAMIVPHPYLQRYQPGRQVKRPGP